MNPRLVEYPELGLTVVMHGDELAEFVQWEPDEADDDEDDRSVDCGHRVGYIDSWDEGGPDIMNRLTDDDTHTITIDLPMEEPLDDLESMAKHDLLFKLLERVGPGGGNPHVQLTGKVSNLRAWIAEWYFGGTGHQDDIEFHLWGE